MSRDAGNYEMTKRKDGLNPKEAKFLAKFIESNNVAESFRTVYGYPQMSNQMAYASGRRVLDIPRVKEKLTAHTNLLVRRTQMSVVDVFQEWLDIIRADPTELVTIRRVNCRHCWGRDHKYRWRDSDEFAVAQAEVLDWNSKPDHATTQRPLPNDVGGYGWRKNHQPNSDCPKCDGEGHLDLWIADLATVSPQALKLFAGIKQTQHGIELKLHDRMGAIENVAKALGMFKTVIQLDMGGGEEKEVQAPVTIEEAAKVYQLIVGGKK